MYKHKGIPFSAAGDPGQLELINQRLSVISNKWYEMVFAQMFPRRLTLQISKRCAGKDREHMHKRFETKPTTSWRHCRPLDFTRWSSRTSLMKTLVIPISQLCVLQSLS